jgi:hypothetical protein
MIAGLVILIAIDVALSVAGLEISRSPTVHSPRGLPAGLAVMLASGALFVHLIALVILRAFAGEALGMGGKMAWGSLTGAAPAAIYAHLLTLAFSGRAVHYLYGSEEVSKPRDEEFGVARRHFTEGDIDGALAEYRNIALRYPHCPDPLWGAAGMLEMAQRHEEAAAIWRELLQADKMDDMDLTRDLAAG